MSSPDEFAPDLDGALSDALNRRAASVKVPDDGMARFEQHLADDTRHRHRRHIAMSVTGVVAVVAIGTGAVMFAHSRDPHPTAQTVSAAADSLKIRMPSAPSGLPKLLPALPSGWVLESAGDYAPTDTEGSALPDVGAVRVLVYRSDTGLIRAEIRVDPTVAGGFGIDPNGDPHSRSVQVHGQPGVLTVDTQVKGVDTLTWAEGEHTVVTITATGISEQGLVDFGESLQPAAEGWSAFPLPAGFTLVFDGDADAAMGYGGPSWQLGYRGAEDLSQPQDPSISVSASKGTADASVVFPGPSDHPVPVEVGDSAGVLVSSSDSPPFHTLVWFDPQLRLVLTVNASGIDEGDLLAFAASLHSVSDEEWQKTVADVLPKPDEPTGPVEPPAPTQPIALPALASGSLPDGRTWTIDGTQYRDAPDANLVCGDLRFSGSSDTTGSACANSDGSPRLGIGIGTDGGTLLFGAAPANATSVTIERTDGAPLTATTATSADPSVAARWFVVEVPDAKKVTAIVGHDDAGSEVSRLEQPLGPPYPDYEVLDKAAKRMVASGTVDGAAWTLTAADAPLSDGTGPITCVTLTFAAESSMTCPVVVVGGVNGSGIIDATVALLRSRTFVLAHLDAGVAELRVDLDDGSLIRVSVIATGSASGSTAAVVHVPAGARPLDLHAIDAHGNDMGAVDISAVGLAPHPTPFAIDDSARTQPAG
jgi:hypothetical protein